MCFQDGKIFDTLKDVDSSSLANKISKVVVSIHIREPVAPASLGMAARSTILETVKKLAKENGSFQVES